MMKKTLIALALAATTVSGSAMAWTANGLGGNLDLGGTLTPQVNVTPWQVLVGSAVPGLNADIKIGSKVVDVPVNKAIPILAIRTQSKQLFKGGAGLTPQVDFAGAVDINGMSNSTGVMSMNVVNVKDNAIIGGLEVPVLTGARGAWTDTTSGKSYARVIYASQAGKAFFGGVPKSADRVDPVDTFPRILSAIPGISDNWLTPANVSWQGVGEVVFATPQNNYTGLYGAAIEAGKSMKLTLKTPAASDAIEWKASLPVTVSYQ